MVGIGTFEITNGITELVEGQFDIGVSISILDSLIDLGIVRDPLEELYQCSGM